MIARDFFLVLGLCWFSSIASMQTGNRISAMLQTLHKGWKTQLMDISLQQMPKFRVRDTSVIRVTLPRENDNSPEMKLDPSEDVKISMTFDGNKLVIPWIVLFDSKNRRTLRKMSVFFHHDEFEIVRFRYELQYSPPISRFDPGHPSLTAFEIDYFWEPIQEYDLSEGLLTFFSAGLVAIVAIFVTILCTYDRSENPEMLVKK